MNGRVYDPTLGRMLSPDPVTQAPENGQNYNRYSYAYNNPLKFTDPSGFENKKIVCEGDSCSQAGGVSMGEVLVTAKDLSGGGGFSGNQAALAFSGNGPSSISTMNGVMEQNFLASRVQTAIDAGAAVAVNEDGDLVGGDGNVVLRTGVVGVDPENWWARHELPDGFYDNKIAGIDVNNILTGIGGLGQIGTGVLACATGAGCFGGVPLIVLGVSNVGESITSMVSANNTGFNFVQESLGLSPSVNAAVNLTADLVGLNAPVLAKGSWKLFNHIPSDYSSSVKYQASRSGVVLNAATTANTTVSGIQQ